MLHHALGEDPAEEVKMEEMSLLLDRPTECALKPLQAEPGAELGVLLAALRDRAIKGEL